MTRDIKDCNTKIRKLKGANGVAKNVSGSISLPKFDMVVAARNSVARRIPPECDLAV